MIGAGADRDDLLQVPKLAEEARRRRPDHGHRDFTHAKRIDVVASKHPPAREGGAKRLEPWREILALDMDDDRLLFAFSRHERDYAANPVGWALLVTVDHALQS